MQFAVTNKWMKPAEDILHSVFMGEFIEKRYIESLQSYRHVIVVDSEEKRFVQLLQAFVRKAVKADGECKWLGITSDENLQKPAYYIWTQMEGLTFGKHWFLVRSVKVDDSEISLELECLRSIGDSACYAQTTSTLYSSEVKLTGILTLENAQSALRFTMVLLLALFAFIVQSLAYLMDYFLQSMHTLAALIDALTPTFLGILDFLGRCIAGFYWLILMMWRGNANPALARDRQLRITAAPTTDGQNHDYSFGKGRERVMHAPN